MTAASDISGRLVCDQNGLSAIADEWPNQSAVALRTIDCVVLVAECWSP